VLCVQLDWTDIAWYRVGIVPLVAVDWLLGVRSRPKPRAEAIGALEWGQTKVARRTPPVLNPSYLADLRMHCRTRS
jgi:hypothetical protein